jgi:hypothetical protein
LSQNATRPPGEVRRPVIVALRGGWLPAAVASLAYLAIPWDARASVKRVALPFCRANDPDSPDAFTSDYADQASVPVLSMVFMIGECSNGSDVAYINNPSLVQY